MLSFRPAPPLLLLALLVVRCIGFTFLYPSVSPSSLTINTLTTYQFVAMRNFDSSLASTPYITSPVPAGSNITLIFPSQYDIATHAPSLDSVEIDFAVVTGYSIVIVGNNFTITGAVPATSAIATVSLTLSSVMNPSPALTTDPFLLAIGNDISVSSSASAITLTPASFLSCNLSFSPSTVNTTSQLQVALSPANAISDGGYIKIIFPSSLQWSQDVSTNHALPLSSVSCGTLTGDIQSGSCSGSTASASVIFTASTIAGGQTNNSFGFGVSGLFSPPTTSPPDTLTITSYSKTNYQIDICTATIAGLTAHQLSLTVGASNSPLYINTATSLILTFTLLDTLSKTDYFVLVLPSGASFSFIVIATFNLAIFSSGVTYDATNNTLVMKQAVTSPTRYTGTLCTITLGRYTSPPSTLTTLPFTLNVYDSSNGLKMTGQNTLTATAKSYTATMTSLSVLVNAATSYTLVLTTQDNMLAAGLIALTFPSQLALSIGASCVTASNITSKGTIVCSLSSQTVTLSNLSTSTIAPGVYSFTIATVTNPNRALTTSSFSAVSYYTNNLNAQLGLSSMPGIAIQPKPIPTISTALSDYTVAASSVTLNITFTNVDALPTQGSIQVTIPPQIAFVNGYLPQCLVKINSNSYALGCSLSSFTFTIPLVDHTLGTGDAVTLSFISFGTNPATTKPTSPLQIYTATKDGYLVDYSNATAVVSGFTPGEFLTANITATSKINLAGSNYSVNLQQGSKWGSNSVLRVTLPKEVTVSTSLSCYNGSSGVQLVCAGNSTAVPQVVDVTLPDATNAVNVILVTLTNPPSLKPSSAFTLETLSSEGYAYCISSSVTVTTTLPSAFVSVSYTFSSQVYNSSSNLSLTMVHRSSSNQLTLAQFSQFTTSPTCSEATISVSCSIQGTTLVIVPTNASLLYPMETNLLVQGLTIPATTVQAMTLQSYDTGYLVSEYSPLQWSSGCDIPCLTCLPATPSVCLSCFSDSTFTTSIYFYNSSCLAACPVGTYLSNASCLNCSSPCSQCTTSTSCSECDQLSATPILNPGTHTCLATCPSGSYPSTTSTTKYTPICLSCVSPCATCVNATSCLSCSDPSLYYYLGQCLAACPADVTIANTSAMTCDPCSNLCLTCVNTTTTCLTCNTAVAQYLVVATGQCLAQCPAPLVPEGQYCVACSSPCSSCQAVKTNCTGCLSGYFLSSTTPNSCVTSCEEFSFPNATSNTCQLCSSLAIFCRNCFNQSYCLSCDPPYVLMLTSHACLTAVPSGYVNISGIATACSPPCSTCSVTISNCTSCSAPQSLYTYLGSGECLDNCPTGTVPISYLCQPCQYPCLTCDAVQSNCTSCITGYLLEYQCPNSCPLGTFINATAVTCDLCLAPCATCQGDNSYCLSCTQGFLYGSQCVNECPSGTATAGRTCLPCVSPCLTCAAISTNCTGCLPNYYFYSSTSLCYSSCPADISVNDTSSTSLNCLPCSSPCLYCSVAPTQCTACATGSLYQSQCYATCPDGYYGLGGICQLCTGNCLTCVTTSNTCTSCVSPFLKYGTSCLSSCPVTHSIVVANTCTSCSNSCLNCNSSDYCSSCPSNLALYLGTCLSVCPSPLLLYYNTSSGQLNCFTQSQINTQNNQQTLTSSLQITSVLPLPFTIICSFLFLCCLMSKLQHTETYVTGVAYSLYGCAESGAISFVLFVFQRDQQGLGEYSAYLLLLWICLGLIFTLNAIGLIMITPCLCSDPQFSNWLRHKPRGSPPEVDEQKSASFELQTGGSTEQDSPCCSHRCTFAGFSILSFLINYKARMLIFTKLFRFSSLTAQLENIQGFRIFNLMSYLGIFYEGLYCYIAIKFFGLFSYADNKAIWLATLDAFVLVLASFVLALVATQKDQNFFRGREERKAVDLGRRKVRKDKHNFKIDPDRAIGMNSRDKLIDINESISSMDQQDIYVNHNIQSKLMPSRVTSQWVQTSKRHNQHRSPPLSSRSPRDRNIFDLPEREGEDQSYLPFSSRNRELSITDRIQLYHNSVKPSVRPVQSRVSVYEGEIREKEHLAGAVPGESRTKDVEIQSHFQIDGGDGNDKGTLGQGGKQSIVNINIQGNNAESAHSKVGDQMYLHQRVERPQIKLTQSQLLQSTAKPKGAVVPVSPYPVAVIKETQSQNCNSSGIKRRSEKSNALVQGGKLSSGRDIAADDLDKTASEGIIQQNLRQKSYDSVLPFIHEDGILKAKPKQRHSDKVMIPKKLQKPQTPKQGAVVANSYLLEQQQNQKQKGDLQNLLQVSEIQEESPQMQSPPKKAKGKMGFAPIQLSTMISPYPIPTSINQQVDLKENREEHQRNRNRNSMGMASRQLDQKILPEAQESKEGNRKDKEDSRNDIEDRNKTKEGSLVTHAPKVFSRTNLTQGQPLVDIDELQQFQLKLTKREEELNHIKTELMKKNRADLQSRGPKRSKRSLVSDPSLFPKSQDQNHQLIVLQKEGGNRQKPSNRQYYDQQEQLQEVQLYHADAGSEGSKQVEESMEEGESGTQARNIFDQPAYTESELGPALFEKREPPSRSVSINEPVSSHFRQDQSVEEDRNEPQSQEQENELQQIEINSNKQSPQQVKESRSIQQRNSERQESKEESDEGANSLSNKKISQKQDRSRSRSSRPEEEIQKQYRDFLQHNIDKGGTKVEIDPVNQRPLQRQVQLNNQSAEHPQESSHNLPYVIHQTNSIAEVSEPISKHIQQQEENDVEQILIEPQLPTQLYRIENKSRQQYSEEAGEQGGTERGRQQVDTKQQIGQEFQNKQIARQTQPQYVIEEEEGDLTQQESKEATVYNQPYLDREDSKDIMNVTDSLRKTSRTKKKIPVPPHSEEPYRSPFIFSQNQQTGPLETAQDEDDGIHGKTRRSRVNPQQTKNQSEHEAAKTEKKDHYEVMKLLNQAQRNSRSKKKLPKEETDERIVIKMSRQDLRKQPQQREESNLARKSMEKNKPIGAYTLKKDEQSYSEEGSIQPERPYRQNQLLKNKTALQLQSKIVQRPSRLLQQKAGSSFDLYQKEAEIPEIVLHYPKKEQRNEVREFNFGDQISSQVSHFNSEAEMVKWKQNFIRDSSSSNIQPQYQVHNVPAKPHVNKVTELDEYYEEEQADSDLRKPSSKGRRHRSKRKKNQSKGRNSQLQKIYGL